MKTNRITHNIRHHSFPGNGEQAAQTDDQQQAAPESSAEQNVAQESTEDSSKTDLEKPKVGRKAEEKGNNSGHSEMAE